MLLTPRAPSTAAEGALRRLLFPPYWRVLRVESLLDELLDLPSGNIEFAGNRRPDHRDLPILPGGGKLHGAGLVSRRRGGEDAGHLVGGIDVQVHFGLPHRRVLRGLWWRITSAASSRSQSWAVLFQVWSDKATAMLRRNGSPVLASFAASA